MTMSVARSRAAWRRTVLLWLAAYALVVLASPVLHHDFDCHLKNPGHCVACVSSPIGATTTAQPGSWSGPLPDAGQVADAQPLAAPVAVRVDVIGRAPPA
jgi:hypothetical protein